MRSEFFLGDQDIPETGCFKLVVLPFVIMALLSAFCGEVGLWIFAGIIFLIAVPIALLPLFEKIYELSDYIIVEGGFGDNKYADRAVNILTCFLCGMVLLLPVFAMYYSHTVSEASLKRDQERQEVIQEMEKRRKKEREEAEREQENIERAIYNKFVDELEKALSEVKENTIAPRSRTMLGNQEERLSLKVIEELIRMPDTDKVLRIDGIKKIYSDYCEHIKVAQTSQKFINGYLNKVREESEYKTLGKDRQNKFYDLTRACEKEAKERIDFTQSRLNGLQACLNEAEKLHSEHQLKMQRLVQGKAEQEKKAKLEKDREIALNALKIRDVSRIVQLLEETPDLLTEEEKSGIEQELYELKKFGSYITIKDHRGDTPLHNATSQKEMEFLLKNGADVNAKNKRNRTPLHHATGNLRLAKILVENGADINAEDIDGKTPLDAAVWHGIESVKFFVEQGASVDVQDNAGRTPLHVAAIHGSREVIEYFVQKTSDINKVDKNGETALDHSYSALDQPRRTVDRSRVKTAIQILTKHGGKRKKQPEANIFR